MPVSPEYGEALAQATVDLYRDAEWILLDKIARRLRRGILQSGWADEKLAQVQTLRREVEELLGKLTPEGQAAIEEALRKAYNRGTASAQADLAAAGHGKHFIGVNERAITNLLVETVQRVQATHLRILRVVPDIFRQTVSEASSHVIAGTLTRREAAQRALNRLAAKGITGYISPNGVGYDLTSYVEMATRTATGHAAVQGHLDRLTEAGEDLVIVSNAGGECHLCRPWEGKVLSISGNDRNHESLADARAGGLFHPRCRHSTGLYVDGFTKPMTDTADPQGDADRQQLRYLERQVRDWKTREVLALDDSDASKAATKVSYWQSRIREHVDETGLLRQRQREQIGSAR